MLLCLCWLPGLQLSACAIWTHPRAESIINAAAPCLAYVSPSLAVSCVFCRHDSRAGVRGVHAGVRPAAAVRPRLQGRVPRRAVRRVRCPGHGALPLRQDQPDAPVPPTHRGAHLIASMCHDEGGTSTTCVHESFWQAAVSSTRCVLLVVAIRSGMCVMWRWIRQPCTRCRQLVLATATGRQGPAAVLRETVPAAAAALPASVRVVLPLRPLP